MKKSREIKYAQRRLPGSAGVDAYNFTDYLERNMIARISWVCPNQPKNQSHKPIDNLKKKQFKMGYREI